MKLEQAARQALEALREYRDTQMISAPRRAINSLLLALDEQTGQSQLADATLEPVGYFAYDEEHDIWEELTGPNAPGATKLYAAPVRTKDLTDDDLEKTYDEICRNASSSERLLFRYARAVIAADREKNCGAA